MIRTRSTSSSLSLGSLHRQRKSPQPQPLLFQFMIVISACWMASVCPITYALHRPNSNVKIDIGRGSHTNTDTNTNSNLDKFQCSLSGGDYTFCDDNGDGDIIIHSNDNVHHENMIQSISIRGGASESSSSSSSLIIRSFQALKRAIVAGFDAFTYNGEDDDNDNNDDEERSMISSTPLGRVYNVITSMVKAAFDPDFERRGGSTTSATTKNSHKKDLASYFSHAYGVSLDADRDDDADADDDGDQSDKEDQDKIVKVMGGSLSHALDKARSKARLLVIYIPGNKPHKSKSNMDATAIRSILSSQVYKISERNARKKEEGKGSFLFWGAKYNSNDANVALKRLKIKAGNSNSKSNNPTLMVVYPSPSIDSSGTRTKIIPRVVAQHHCNPPPSEDVMASWLNALRKRHAKQYTAMQLELKEKELFKERIKGYQSSMEDDKTRLKKERVERERVEQEEAKKKQHDKEMKVRRKTLLANLPDEPSKGENINIVTIALRFSDGRRGQRRFDGESTLLEDVFNWVDAMFEMERERVVLTTMNGQRTFVYGDGDGEDGDDMMAMTLADVGLGKMAALRVTEQEDEDEEEENANDDQDEEDDEEEDEEE